MEHTAAAILTGLGTMLLAAVVAGAASPQGRRPTTGSRPRASGTRLTSNPDAFQVCNSG
jgi:hypothetical protein